MKINKEWHLANKIPKNPSLDQKVNGILTMPNIAPVVRDALGWGFLLWLMGYGLGIILFAVVPLWLIG